MRHLLFACAFVPDESDERRAHARAPVVVLHTHMPVQWRVETWDLYAHHIWWHLVSVSELYLDPHAIICNTTRPQSEGGLGIKSKESHTCGGHTYAHQICLDHLCKTP